ncbi:MAG TPA: molybdenum cofactor guanylyltransferase [Streptosporangiaceae bacterium]|jgi:molybdopterin-guanine dinucleotide biosynthesis protein A|nr:molybdenum cofactor guanylyltransferase [Streptosporangiaceae bacterium]
MPRAAGIVLAGGRSSRMGTSKADLEWHGSTLLRRTVGILARATGGPVLVVRAPGQALPDLAGQAEIVDDPAEGLGPVQGLAAGLAAVASRAEAAFVCATDLPFLHPAFVRRVLRARDGGADMVLPVARGYPQPLAAAYAVTLAPVAARMVAGGRLRLGFLFEECAAARLDEAALCADPELAAADPGLDSLVNVNEPGEYRAARARPAPEVTIERRRAGGEHAGPWPARAATVAAAAAAAGLTLDRRVAVELNGEPVVTDGHLPLVRADRVTLFVR